MDIETLPIEILRRRLGIKWSKYPDDVIPAWVADMDFPLAPPIRDYLRQAVDDSDVGYPKKAGDEPLPEVFAARMQQRFGWQIPTLHASLVTDVVQALYLAIDAYSEPGAGVIIHTPIYPPFLAAVEDTGRTLLANPLTRAANGFELDFDRLAKMAASAQIMMLCNPHNPSGRVFTRVELEKLADLALTHDLVVLSDEIHSDLTYPGHRHIPFASLDPQIAARTVTFNSATKAFNTAGLRVAIAAFGSEELKRRFDSVPERVRGGLSVFAAEVTKIAWTECDDWLADALTYLQANRDFLAEHLRERASDVEFAVPEGTYLAWLDFSALDLGEDPYEFFLSRAKVALSPGPSFGDTGRDCARLNFATSRPILEQIIERLCGAMG